eukprot:1392972-Amorphochlora_amoeboformis.AAC.1
MPEHPDESTPRPPAAADRFHSQGYQTVDTATKEVLRLAEEVRGDGVSSDPTFWSDFLVIEFSGERAWGMYTNHQSSRGRRGGGGERSVYGFRLLATAQASGWIYQIDIPLTKRPCAKHSPMTET